MRVLTSLLTNYAKVTNLRIHQTKCGKQFLQFPPSHHHYINTRSFYRPRNLSRPLHLSQKSSFIKMASQVPLQISNTTTTNLSSVDARGGLRKSFPHCIANNLPKETVKSVIDNIFKKTSGKDATSVYTSSAEWIQSLSTSIANELSANFNVPAENFSESSTKIANVVSGIGNGTWSS
ncbi:16321_t:CDS:2, partial [Rhizophagus irregularis]